ncbi:MAG: hypothetical protein R3E91_01640 [Chlamydiales bacterium]
MRYLFVFLILISVCLFGQNQENHWTYNGDYPLFDLENTPSPAYPCSLSFQYVNAHNTTFRTPSLYGKNLKYLQWDAAFAYTHSLSNYSGLIFGTGWVGTEINMEDNPEFSNPFFKYVNFSIGGFTKAYDHWTWTSTLAAFFDVEKLSLADYTLYQFVLWGKYDFSESLELDFGFILELGLCKEKIWPIIGFTYLPAKKWQIHAVYPINLSVNYLFSSNWMINGSIRLLRNRYRLQNWEINSRGVLEYYTSGAEVDLIFNPFQWASLKGFIGHTFDGALKIADANDKNGTYYKFKGSLYSGLSVVVSF